MTSATSSVPMLRDKTPIAPYRLREGSKLPSRYRDTEPEPPTRIRSPSKPKMTSPRKSLSSASASPARRTLTDRPESSQPQVQPEPAVLHVNSLTSSCDSFIDVDDREYPVLEEQPSTSFPNSQQHKVTVSKASSYSNLSSAGGSDGSQSQHACSPLVLDDDATQRGQDRGKKLTKHDKERESLGEKVGLKRLQNILLVTKARRWTICEFFYSAVDEQLFLADNEFSQIMQESFPNLKTMMLNKQEWRTIRRLLGKPRRCSPLFFSEERAALDQKRAKIRSIYAGTYLSQPNYDVSDLPMRLPRPLQVGMRVYARITLPKDGLYSGTIDAVLTNGYRIIFEKEDMLEPKVVPDYQVMLDGRLELVPISYFIEQSSSKLPFSISRMNASANAYVDRDRRHDVVAMAHTSIAKRALGESTQAQVDRVGNFPVRMLVILVKLSKLIDAKKRLIRQLSELNAEAERANLLTDAYHPGFQEKYAQVVMDLEALNKQMGIYLQGIQEYNSQLVPQVSDANMVARPDALRRVCTTHAHQIVKHCNQGLNVNNPRALTLVTSLTALLLQIRTLGQQKITPLDLHILSESINEIRSVISAKNVAWFQDHVEVHMKQIHNTMLQKGAFTG